MKIAYYMPFKPLGHKNPSGDLIIGTELFQFLQNQGSDIFLASRFRCRWIYLKPYLWPLLFCELIRVYLHCRKKRPDIWMTYHSYYKAPDIIGLICSRMLGIPYTIFQGVYSTKRRRSLRTVIGFYLNRAALCNAACVFTNKINDKKNLRRLLPEERVVYIPPGVEPQNFVFDQEARARIRRKYQCENSVVIMSAAMFRTGVKTEGIEEIIAICRTLKQKGRDVFLMIAGDGANRDRLQEAAFADLGEEVCFLGCLQREMMARYYSAADIFAFPGRQESLGMVYLEAQSCRLPVVAYGDWGAAEAVVDERTGLLASVDDTDSLVFLLDSLVMDAVLRRKMGRNAEDHVLKNHDLLNNYGRVSDKLVRLADLAK